MNAVRSACVLVFAATAAAQPAPAGNLAGRWQLNTYLSDSPEHVAQAIRYDTGEVADELPARAKNDGGRRAEPARTPPKERKDPLAPDDRKKLKELTDDIQFAPTSLTISQSGGEVTLVTPMQGTRVLHTTGKAEKYTLNAGVIERAAAWEGPTLVVTYDLGAGGVVRYTYLLVPSTGQLLVRVNYERPGGEPAPLEIKLVYDRLREP